MGIRHVLLALMVAHSMAVRAADVKAPADGPIASDAPLDCETDKDCPVMSCGPCTPGTSITHAMYPGPSCAVNPCLDASAVCNAQHHCEIGPGTRKNPAVWKQR